MKLNEEETRVIIDFQLRTAGWEAATWTLRHFQGARPEKNTSKAIAEQILTRLDLATLEMQQLAKLLGEEAYPCRPENPQISRPMPKPWTKSNSAYAPPNMRRSSRLIDSSSLFIGISGG